MASGPDLFVICKNCGSEVSPYVTECPYCGTRVRKRAPKLERGGGAAAEPSASERRRSVPRPSRPTPRPLRTEREPRSGRPYATIALVLASVLVSLVWRAGGFAFEDVALVGPLGGEPWRLLTAPFLYVSTGHEIAALGGIALFGYLLERRHGFLAPLLVFVVGGAAGMALASTAGGVVLASGGHGAALALLGAWAVPDLLARRQPVAGEREADLIGLLVIFSVLFAMPLVDELASVWSGLGGVLCGLLLGFPLARRHD